MRVVQARRTFLQLMLFIHESPLKKPILLQCDTFSLKVRIILVRVLRVYNGALIYSNAKCSSQLNLYLNESESFSFRQR